MDVDDLMRKTLATLAGTGEIYADETECAASVAAAQNLHVLAGLLSNANQIIARGILRADGEDLCELDVNTNGSLWAEVPAGIDNSGRVWTLATSDSGEFLIGHFAGVTADDDRWVVENVEAFYRTVLHSPDPLSPPAAGATSVIAFRRSQVAATVITVSPELLEQKRECETDTDPAVSDREFLTLSTAQPSGQLSRQGRLA